MSNEFEQQTWPGWETLSSAEQIFVRENWDNAAALSDVARIMMKAKKKAEPLGGSERSGPVKITVTLGGQKFPLEIENETCAKLGGIVLMRRDDVWDTALGGFNPLRHVMDEFNQWARMHPKIFRFASID